jgi:hypothetical protein
LGTHLAISFAFDLAILVGCQIGLYVGAAVTNKVLDGAIATVNFGSSLLGKGLNSGHYIEGLVIGTVQAIHFYVLV